MVLNVINCKAYKIPHLILSLRNSDKTINIIIDAPGQGGYVGEQNGIKFVIHSNEKDRHEHEPHIHCIYAGEEMRVRIDTLEIMKKDKELKNKKKVKIAIKWIKENQKELLKYYNCFAIQGNDNIKFENDLYEYCTEIEIKNCLITNQYYYIFVSF